MEVGVLVIVVFAVLLVLLLIAAYAFNRYVCVGYCDGSDVTASLQDTESQASENDDVISGSNCTSNSSGGGVDLPFQLLDGGGGVCGACAAEEEFVGETTPSDGVKGHGRCRGYQQCPIEMDEKDNEQSSYPNDSIEESLL